MQLRGKSLGRGFSEAALQFFSLSGGEVKPPGWGCTVSQRHLCGPSVGPRTRGEQLVIFQQFRLNQG